MEFNGRTGCRGLLHFFLTICHGPHFYASSLPGLFSGKIKETGTYGSWYFLRTSQMEKWGHHGLPKKEGTITCNHLSPLNYNDNMFWSPEQSLLMDFECLSHFNQETGSNTRCLISKFSLATLCQFLQYVCLNKWKKWPWISRVKKFIRKSGECREYLKVKAHHRGLKVDNSFVMLQYKRTH